MKVTKQYSLLFTLLLLGAQYSGLYGAANAVEEGIEETAEEVVARESQAAAETAEREAAEAESRLTNLTEGTQEHTAAKVEAEAKQAEATAARAKATAAKQFQELGLEGDEFQNALSENEAAFKKSPEEAKQHIDDRRVAKEKGISPEEAKEDRLRQNSKNTEAKAKQAEYNADAAEKKATEANDKLKKAREEREELVKKKDSFSEDEYNQKIKEKDEEINKLQQEAKTAEDKAKAAADEAKAARKNADDAQAKYKEARGYGSAARDALSSLDDAFTKFDKEFSGAKVLEGVQGAAGKLTHGLEELGLAPKELAKTLINAVVFMIPNIIQTSIENELQRKAALKTLATPQRYGNWVVQILDSAIDENHPSQSLPLYAMIPVNKETASISSTISEMFDGISGPAIESELKTGVLAATTFGQAAESFSLKNINRYQILPSKYLYSQTIGKHVGKIVTSYPSQSYNSIGDSTITGPQFDGLLVDLNDGYVIRANAERFMPGDSDISPPLVDMTANAPQEMQQNVKSIKESLTTILEKMETAGMVYTYKEYEGTKTGTEVKAILRELFDSSNAKCLVNRALAKYSHGADFGEYTGIIPMFGWGTKYGWGSKDPDNFITTINFPHSAPESAVEQAEESGGELSFGKVSGIGKATMKQVTVDSSESFGDPEKNYAAEGCWVYISTETPFAKRLQKAVHSTNNGVQGPFVDYIICLDKDNNQVPLMAPVATTPGLKGIAWPTIGLNPNVTHVASLLSTSMQQFKIEHAGESYAVMYTKDGIAESTPDGGQTIEAVVQQAIKTLKNDFPDLYNQFSVHREALLSRFLDGPFEYGDVTLEKSDDYSVQIKTSNVALYQGTKDAPAYCYGTTGSNGIQDILLPMSGDKTVVLPSDKVEKMVSLVTDIAYQVGKDGSLTADRVNDFAYAPGTWNGTSFIPSQAKEDNFTYLGMIAGAAGKGNAVVEKLETYVQQQRKNWLAVLNGKPVSHGARKGMLSFTIPAHLDKQQLDSARCYIYTVKPNPSADIVHKDWFIAVPSETPSFTSMQMIDMTSANSSKAKSIVSLVTGMVYDMNGKPRKTASGHGMFFKTPVAAGSQETTAEYLFNYFTSKAYSDVLSEDFVKAYHEATIQYTQNANRLISQGMFGEIPLAIYASDFASENYVYVNASGMNTSKDFKPIDLLVTFNFDTKGNPVLGEALSSNTQNLLSLVSGNVYKSTGLSGSVPMSTITGYVQMHSPNWRRWLSSTLHSLQAAYVEQQAAEKKEEETLERDTKKLDSKITLTQSQVQAIIKRLGSVLPVPYQTLKQDVLTQKFVHLSPANPNNPNEFIYLLFDVPNTFKDATGKSVAMGGIYTEKGELVQVLKGAALEAMKHQFGLFGAAAKTLGVPVQQPSMLMSRADKDLRMGQDGESLIESTSDAFPGAKVRMPNGYYLYYNTIMNTYYVFDTQKERWVGVVGGNVYDRSGQPIPAKQHVALSDSGSADNHDFIMLEENNAGYMQGYMKDPGANNKFAKFINDGSGTWTSVSSSATVQEAKSTQGKEYNVQFGNNDTKMYVVDHDYTWEDLVYLPLTKDKTLLSRAKMPSKSLQDMKVVKYNGAVMYALFNGVMYKAAPTQGRTITMTPVSSATASEITLDLLTDVDTNAPYIKVSTQKGNEYRYVYLYERLDTVQQEAYKTTIIKGAVTTCPAALPVRKKVVKAIKQSDGSIKDIEHKLPDTHVLFTANINVASLQDVQLRNVVGVPSETSSLYSTFANTLFRVKQSRDNRFFAQIFKNDGNPVHKPFITYFNRDGYVDLQTGALFDNSGHALGVSLTIKDWLKVLDTLNITVNYNQKGYPALFYRNAAAVEKQLRQQQVFDSVNQQVDTEDLSNEDIEQEAPKLRVSKKSQPKSLGKIQPRRRENIQSTVNAQLPPSRQVGQVTKKRVTPKRPIYSPYGTITG